MQLKFIIDTQLPPSLVKILRKQKINAIHTIDFPNGHLLNDYEITQIAIKQSLIIITKDHDFFENFILVGSPPKILLLKIGNTKNSDLFKIIEENISFVRKFFLYKKADLIIIDEKSISYY